MEEDPKNQNTGSRFEEDIDDLFTGEEPEPEPESKEDEGDK